MGTFKLEVRQQFGKFSRRIYARGATPPEFAGDLDKIGDVVDSLDDDLKAAKAGKGDAIVFRNIEYTDRRELKYAVRDAPY